MTTHRGYRRVVGDKPVRVLESVVQAQIVSWLEIHGWLVRVTSQTTAVKRGMVGFPDVIAFKAGVTVLIEVKRPGGKMREGQIQFAHLIAEHSAATLAHTVADDLDVFAAWLARVEFDACIRTVQAQVMA